VIGNKSNSSEGLEPLLKKIIKMAGRKIGRMLIRRLVRTAAGQRLQAFLNNASVLKKIGK
jgi:hypothetical protein